MNFVMTLVKSLAASAMLAGMMATTAFAGSMELPDSRHISPSVMLLGEPDPCENGACDEKIAVVEERADSNAALVDAYGMPTSMPIIMRPSVDTPPAQATAEATPAATTPVDPNAPTPADPNAPAATPEAEPAPAAEPAPEVIQAPAEPAQQPLIPEPQAQNSGPAVN